MSTELEGDALFYAAARAIGDVEAMPSPWLFDAKWMLVPAMLEWLRRSGDIEMRSYADGGAYVAWLNSDGHWHNCYAPDLPTALARLVLRVKELEHPAKGEGEK